MVQIPKVPHLNWSKDTLLVEGCLPCIAVYIHWSVRCMVIFEIVSVDKWINCMLVVQQKPCSTEDTSDILKKGMCYLMALIITLFHHICMQLFLLFFPQSQVWWPFSPQWEQITPWYSALCQPSLSVYANVSSIHASQSFCVFPLCWCFINWL